MQLESDSVLPRVSGCWSGVLLTVSRQLKLWNKIFAGQFCDCGPLNSRNRLRLLWEQRRIVRNAAKHEFDYAATL